MSKKLVLLIVALGAAGAAQAHEGDFHFLPPPPPHYSPFTPAAAPEIDPAGATSAFALLAGGLVLIRGRRRSSK